MKANTILSVYLLILLLRKTLAQVHIEARLRECQDNLNSLNSCLSQLMEDIRPFMAEGIPELNLPVLDPMLLENLTFSQRDGPINIRARFDDVHVHGFSNFTLQDLRTDLNKLQLRVRIHIPFLRVSGKYRLDGNLLLLAITGDGPFTSNLHGIEAGMLSQIVVKKSATGKERLGVENTRINFKLRKARTILENLFNGDRILGNTVNHFINANDQMILRELKPAVSRDFALLVQAVMDSALSTLPVSLINPPPQPLN